MSKFLEMNAADPSRRRKVLNSGLTRSSPLQYPLKDDNGYKATLSFQVVDEEKHRVQFTDNLAEQFTDVPALTGGAFAGVKNLLGSVFGKESSKERIKQLTGSNDKLQAQQLKLDTH